MSTPLEECKRLIREGQQDFTHDVDQVLTAIKDCSASLVPAIGEISPGEALELVRQVAVTAIDRCLDRRRG